MITYDIKKHWDYNLIGQDNSRNSLTTPALLIDITKMDNNIQKMAAYCREKGIAIRPHCKTHKCVEIARKQIEAGAIGISCATLGEAEVMVHGKIKGVLITSPLVTASKINRLISLNNIADDLMIVVDDPINVLQLEKANHGKKQLQVLVEFDIGQKRTGAKTIEDAIFLAKQIMQKSSLKFVGIQAYAGHLQHIKEYSERQAMMFEQAGRVRQLCRELKNAGINFTILTGGGTGTFNIDLEEKLYTEIQAGSYIFMDRQYLDVNLKRDFGITFEPALFVQCAVVSANSKNEAIVDAGLKAFSTDDQAPIVVKGAPYGSKYDFMGDEHGKITYAEEGNKLSSGNIVECVVPHCDPTVNLYDVYHCVDDNTLVGLWPIQARGLH